MYIAPLSVILAVIFRRVGALMVWEILRGPLEGRTFVGRCGRNDLIDVPISYTRMGGGVRPRSLRSGLKTGGSPPTGWCGRAWCHFLLPPRLPCVISALCWCSAGWPAAEFRLAERGDTGRPPGGGSWAFFFTTRLPRAPTWPMIITTFEVGAELFG